MDVIKMMEFDRMQRHAALLLAQGMAIVHGDCPDDGKLSGRIQDNSIPQTIYVGNQVGRGLIDARIPLETYENNVAEGWKTIVPLDQRDALLAAIAKADELKLDPAISAPSEDAETLPAPTA